MIMSSCERITLVGSIVAIVLCVLSYIAIHGEDVRWNHFRLDQQAAVAPTFGSLHQHSRDQHHLQRRRRLALQEISMTETSFETQKVRPEEEEEEGADGQGKNPHQTTTTTSTSNVETEKRRTIAMEVDRRRHNIGIAPKLPLYNQTLADLYRGAKAPPSAKVSELQPQYTTLVNKRNVFMDPIWNPPLQNRTQLPYDMLVPYVGVMVDTGLHYFPLEWLRNLLDLMHAMKLNLLHLRLTDETAFSVQLESHPELANPPPGADRVYRAAELRQLVEYAHTRGIVLVPEVGMPARVLGWVGKIPNVLVPCQRFLCNRGLGIFNPDNPRTMEIVKEVIREINDIFYTAPMLHLGGDAIDKAVHCYMEVPDLQPSVGKFETLLRLALKELGIPEERIVRFEDSKKSEAFYQGVERVEGIRHYITSRGHRNCPTERCIVSKGLSIRDMTVDGGHMLYSKTRRLAHTDKIHAILAWTQQLGTEFWMDLNVVGRLLAISMGASNKVYGSERLFDEAYLTNCLSLGIDREVCRFYGHNILELSMVNIQASHVLREGRDNRCFIAAEEKYEAVVSGRVWGRKKAYAQANREFWARFGEEDPPKHHESIMTHRASVASDKQPRLAVNHAGLVLDVVDIAHLTHEIVKHIKAVITDMSQLGLNLLQLRFINDFGVAVEFSTYPQIVWGQHELINDQDLRSIAHHANQAGVAIVPEIALTTRAGGWYGLGAIHNCPKVLCQNGVGVTANSTTHLLLVVAVAFVRNLFEVFQPPFVHLGYDEQQEGRTCLREANVTQDFGAFEEKLGIVLQMEGFPLQRFVRWENKEGVHYPRRVGAITQYQYTYPTEPPESPYFLSTGLTLNDPNTTMVVESVDWFQHVRQAVAQKPDAILAPVLSFERNFYKNAVFRERLATFAMAVSTKYQDLSDKEFAPQLETVLNDLGVKQSVTNRTAASQASQILADFCTQRRSDECDARTFTRRELVPRKGVLVD